MSERLPLVRVDGESRQLPAGDKIPAAAIGPAMPYLADPVDAAALRDALVLAGIMEPPTPAVPENTSPPVVSGAVYVGDTAVASPGTWTNAPTSYAYQWQAYNEISDDWDDVPGENASTFEVDAAGEYRVEVVASNAVGDSAPAYSAPFEVAEAPSTYAPAVVRVASATGDGTNTAGTIDSRGCDAIVVVCSQQDGAGTMTPSSDSGGTFALLESYVTTDGTYYNRTSVWLHTGFTPDEGHTITVANAVFGVLALTGLDASGRPVLVDQEVPASAESASPYSSGTLTPTVGASLAVAAITPINYSGDGSNLVADAPFGNIAGNVDGAFWACASAVATLTGTGPVVATFENEFAPMNVASVYLVNLYCESP